MQPKLYLIQRDENGVGNSVLYRTLKDTLRAIDENMTGVNLLLVAFNKPSASEIIEQIDPQLTGVFGSTSFITSLDMDAVDADDITLDAGSRQFRALRRILDQQYPFTASEIVPARMSQNGLENGHLGEAVNIVPSDEAYTYVDLFSYDWTIGAEEALRCHDITNVEDLICCSRQELLQFPEFTSRIMKEVDDFLQINGLALGEVQPIGSGDNTIPTGLPRLKLNEIFWSVRARNVFKQLGLKTLGELNEVTDEQLSGLHNVGRGTIHEIRTVLRGYIAKPNISRSKTKIVDVPLHKHPWSARTENILRSLRISRLSQLVQVRERDLKVRRNCGAKTIEEIRTYLDSHNLKLGMAPEDLIIEEYDPGVHNIAQSSPSADTTIVMEARYSLHFEERFKQATKNILDDRSQSVIAMRVGLDGERLTLAEVGRQLDITRERVRQIESKAIKKIRSTTSFEYCFEGLRELIADLPSPLTVDYASQRIANLQGATEKLPLLRYILKHFCDSTFHIIKFGYTTYIHTQNQENFNNYLETIHALIETLEGQSLSSIREAVFDRTPKEFEQFAEIVFAEVIAGCSVIERGEIDILLKYSRSHTKFDTICAIIKAAREPMSQSDVVEKLKEQFPDAADRFNVSSFHEVGIYPMGRATFGTIEQLPFDLQRLRGFLQRAEAYLDDVESSKGQVHTRELLGFVPAAYREIMTEWHISAILRDQDIGNYLGRNTFGRKDETRRTIREDVILELKKSRRPMHLSELRTALSRYRSLPEVLPLVEKPPLKLVGKNTWSLEDQNW